MKYFSYAWTVIENLIKLFIVWLLYSIPTSNFETIIISILLIIYAYICSSSSSLSFGLVTSTLKSLKQFLHILQVLKRHDKSFKEIEDFQKDFPDELPYDPIESLYYDDDYTKQELKEQEDKLKQFTIQYFISGGFTFIIYVLAVWKILSIVLLNNF